MSKFIAIDLDPQGIFVVVGSARAGHAKVDAAIAWDGTDGEPPATLTADTAKTLGEQLRERLRAIGPGQTPVFLTIPRDRVILKELKYPKVPPTEEPNVVRFQAMKELTDSAEDVVLDYVPLSNGAAEGERRSMAFAVRREFFTAIQAMCTAANLKLAGVTPRPFAVAAGLTRAIATGAAARGEGAEPVAVVTLGPGGGEFTVYRPATTPGGNEVLFTRTVPAPAVASEPMLVAEVRRNLTMYAGANPGHPAQALYVAETDGRWMNRLKAALGLPVHGYDPLAGTTAGVTETSHGRFAAAVGMLAAAAGELPINFVTPRQPKVEKDPKQKQMLLGAAAAFLVLLVGLGGGMLWVNYEEGELADLQAKKTALEDEVALKEPDYKRYQAVETWKGRGVVWLDMLYDLTDQFRHGDEVAATAFIAKAIQPEMRTGKQDSQAAIEIQLTTRNPETVTAIEAAMEGDNKVPKNPKEVVSKFYTSVGKRVQGAPPGDPLAKEYIITARVTHRSPDDFTRLAVFPTPSRRGYPPPVANSKDKEDPDADLGGQ